MIDVVTPQFIPGKTYIPDQNQNAVGMTDILAPGFNLGDRYINRGLFQELIPEIYSKKTPQAR